MRRVVFGAAVLALLGSAAPAFADRPPDAARVKAAAEQFDGGVAALKQRDFEGAASRFEAADAAVPSAQALRQAMKARLEAGQGSRAATLAALAQQRYPTDSLTLRVAKETIEKVAPLLGRVNVSCASPCVLAIGTRGVVGEANTRWTVYVDPGNVTLAASFFGGAGGAHRDVQAVAGSTQHVRFEPEEKGAAVAAAGVPATTASPPPPGTDAPPADDTDGKKPSGISKAFFFTGLAATAALGGVTIWSGLDTVHNPGADKVRAGCAGQGESCQLYQDGRAKQTRTNALIGATAGAGAVTIVLAIFTRWKSAPPPDASAPAASGAMGPRAAPNPGSPLATLHVEPIVLDRGGALGARGVF